MKITGDFFFLEIRLFVSKNRVPLVGLEPTRQVTPVPKTGTSTIPSQRLILSILYKK